MKFTKATKEQAKLRAAIFGPSGAGKTVTSLRIATGIAGAIEGKIAVIDTERGSASKYASDFDFDVLDLPDHDINTYVQAINAAASAGYEVLVIDSLSHGWKELLQEIDKIAKSKYRGNSWSAWSEGTPKQQSLVNAILDYPGHVIASMRSKTEWTTEVNERGKSQPVRVGLTPEGGKGIEYEFDLLLEINTEHFATVIKDRTGKFQDQVIEMPDEAFGVSLVEWLNDGEPRKASKMDAYNAIKRWCKMDGDELTAAMKSVVEMAGTKEYQELVDYVNAHRSIDFVEHTQNLGVNT